VTNSFQKKRSTVPFLTMFTVLFFWPTYLIPASDFVAQKSFYFIMPFISILVVYVYARRLIIPFESVLFLIFYPLLIHVFLNNLIYADMQKVFVLVKPLFSVIVFVAAYNCSSYFLLPETQKQIGRVINSIYTLLLISIFIQYINPSFSFLRIFNASDIVTPMGHRAPGTFEWVYNTCGVLGLYLIFCLTKLFVYKQKKYMIPIFFSLIAIFISQSKVGYVATLFSVGYLGFLLVIFGFRGGQTLIICMLSLFIASIFLVLASGIEISHISRFIDFITGDGKIDGSTLTRLRQANLAWDTGIENWLYGKPGSYEKVIENAYLDYFYRYALFGLFTIVTFVVLLIFSSFLILKQTAKLTRKYSTLNSLLFSCHVSIVSMAFYALAGNPFDGYKIGFFIALIFGLQAGFGWKKHSH